jgi:hypothetical protein
MRVIVCLASFLMISLTTALGQNAANDSSLSLVDLVRELKVALLQVAEAEEGQNLKLETAVLEAKTSMKIDGNGKISLWVVEVGGGGNTESSTIVKVTLKPPKPGSPSDIGEIHLADVLREAILSGALAIRAAGQGNPPLLADKLEASVHFRFAAQTADLR